MARHSPSVPSARHLDREPLRLEAPLHGGGDLHVVLHQQQLHREPSWVPDPERALNDGPCRSASGQPPSAGSGGSHPPREVSDAPILRTRRGLAPGRVAPAPRTRPRRAVAACGTTAPPATATTTTTAAAATPVIDPGDGGDYHPSIDPADFVATIDNPYLPLIPGTTWVYDGDNPGDPERRRGDGDRPDPRHRGHHGGRRPRHRDDRRRPRRGHLRLVRPGQGRQRLVPRRGLDRVRRTGQPSRDGGSWEYGKDGALPGIAMPAHPTPGMAYRQEFLTGTAEDMAEILSVEPTHRSASAPTRTSC